MGNQHGLNLIASKPVYIIGMEAAYGVPSQNGFGSAVFFEQFKASVDLEKAALQKYQHFIGEKWQRFGGEAWMSAWKQVYQRPAGIKKDIVTELYGIPDPDAANSVPMILDVVENAEAAKAALAAAYNDETVVDLCVYNLGDGEAMSGILVVGKRSNGETTFLVFLLD